MKGPAGPTPAKRRDRALALVLAIAVVAAIAFGASLAYLVNRPHEARIVAVTTSPDPPTSLRAITVTAEVDTGGTDWRPDVLLEYQAYFASYDRGGGPMRFSGGNRYTRDIGPFPDRTEVWIAVAACRGGRQLDVRTDRVVQVGWVLRNGSSALRIDGLRHSPALPRRGDTILVDANVTSNSTVFAVFLMFAYAHSPDFGIANRTMVPVSPRVYATAIDNPFLFGYIFEPGTVFFYRVAAIDETWNTAVTETLTLTIA